MCFNLEEKNTCSFIYIHTLFNQLCFLTFSFNIACFFTDGGKKCYQKQSYCGDFGDETSCTKGRTLIGNQGVTLFFYFRREVEYGSR
jgi:hypothetical protein